MDHDEHLRQHDARMARYDQLHDEHVARMAAHEARMAAHEARMTHMDRQYDKLVQIQLDLAQRHDDHHDRMAALERLQQRQHETLEQMRLTLDAIKELLRERRNGDTEDTP